MINHTCSLVVINNLDCFSVNKLYPISYKNKRKENTMDRRDLSDICALAGLFVGEGWL